MGAVILLQKCGRCMHRPHIIQCIFARSPLSLLIAQIVYFVNFRPFFRYNFYQIIFNITLNNNLIVTRNRWTTSEFRSKIFSGHFQINICEMQEGNSEQNFLFFMKCGNVCFHTECTQTGHNRHWLLLSPWRPRDTNFFRSIIFALFRFHYPFAAAFLTLLVIIRSTTIRIIQFNFREFCGKIFLQPNFTFLVVRIVFTVLQCNTKQWNVWFYESKCNNIEPLLALNNFRSIELWVDN